jgi:hypothetical protein
MPEIYFILAPRAQAPTKFSLLLRRGRKLAQNKIDSCASGASSNRKYFALAPKAQACLKNILNHLL